MSLMKIACNFNIYIDDFDHLGPKYTNLNRLGDLNVTFKCWQFITSLLVKCRRALPNFLETKFSILISKFVDPKFLL